jgi:hypothetical protein
MGTNNNAFGRNRDEKAKTKLTEAPYTARQLVELGIHPNTDISRKRLNRMRIREIVNCTGIVNLYGHDEKLWYCGQISCCQHEAEISEMSLHVRADEIRRLRDVDPELHSDADIVAAGVVLPWEHESSCELNLRQIKDKMDRYGDRKVLWTCKFESWLDKLGRHCPSDTHLFTTFALAIEDFHGPIWVNKHGDRFPLQLTDQSTDK